MSKVTLDDQLLFPSEYLQAVELHGKDLALTIASVSKQELQLRGGGKKVKPVLTFRETGKKLVLNVTNAESIAEMYGTKAEAWINQKVTFYPTTAPFGRTVVDCIRVREKKPKHKPDDLPADKRRVNDGEPGTAKPNGHTPSRMFTDFRDFCDAYASGHNEIWKSGAEIRKAVKAGVIEQVAMLNGVDPSKVTQEMVETCDDQGVWEKAVAMVKEETDKHLATV